MALNERTHTRLTLELESGADPIAGRIRDASGTAREFVGWLGLAEALERLFGPARGTELDDGVRADEAARGART